MKKILFLLLFSWFLKIINAQTSIRPADSIQIGTVIMSFYNWYNKNWKKIDAFHIYTGIKVRDQPPYKINWKEAERYFTFIRSNVPQLGEEFINNERIFFKQCDSAFKAEPDETMPYGFDYDRFTNSQEEPQWLIEELKKSKQWAITGNGYITNVDILSSYNDNGKETETVVMCLVMKKEKNKWKIAKIGCAFETPTEK